MANKAFKGRIQNKHDTLANWTTAHNNNFIPLDGELIVYDDLNKVKIGDGITKVGDLPYLNLDEDDIQILINNILEELDYEDASITDYYVNEVDQSNGIINVNRIKLPLTNLKDGANYSITQKTGTSTYNTVSGTNATALGYSTTASGNYSFASGKNTIASGEASYAEGESTAEGKYSHSEGERTIAKGESQHTQGRFNLIDSENKYAHIVGNGNSTARSNAYTLDWNGNAWFKGDIYINGSNQDDGICITNNFIGATSTNNGQKGLVPTPLIGEENKFLKGDGTWGTLVPNKITLMATEGQTSFSIPFEYDSLSSNLTVYFNGILMKETDNYTVDTTNNTVDLVDFSAEAGDIVTIMGLLGAQSIDFGQEAIDAINEINAAVAAAKEEINNTVSTGKNEINTAVNTAKSDIDDKVEEASAIIEELLADLPSSWDDYLTKNATNNMGANGKITMSSSYSPSNNYDVTTKTYVDNAISTATAAIVTDIYVASNTSPSNTKLLWIDTANSNILKYYNGSAWTPVVVAWS